MARNIVRKISYTSLQYHNINHSFTINSKSTTFIPDTTDEVIPCFSYLSKWHQIKQGMESNPSHQNHRGQRIPELICVGKLRGPLQHTALRRLTHADKEEHSQRKKNGNAYGT